MPTARRIVLLAAAFASLPVLGLTRALAQDPATGTPATSSSPAQPASPTAPEGMAPSVVEKGFVDFQTPGSEPLVQRTEEQNSQLYLHLNAKFMSPYCPGLVLRDCTSSGGQNLREQIRQWLAQGHSSEWITGTMVATYGETVLAAPPFKGAAVVVWIAPAVALLIGATLLIRFLQAQKARAAHEAGAVDSVARTTPIDPDMDRRLEQEIQARLR